MNEGHQHGERHRDNAGKIEMVKKTFWGRQVFLVHLSLVLSTDDTTLFVFEGKACGMGEEDEWEWKIVDATNTNSLVRSDFEVGENIEISR
jgi:hypothetical protein